MYGALANSEPNLTHWTVEIADECQQSILTVIFPMHFKIMKYRAQVNGAHALQRRLAKYWNENPIYRSRSVVKSHDRSRTNHSQTQMQ
jgi:hypothetical protein